MTTLPEGMVCERVTACGDVVSVFVDCVGVPFSVQVAIAGTETSVPRKVRSFTSYSLLGAVIVSIPCT